jgi:CDP-glucose 4,6-dehydratase
MIGPFWRGKRVFMTGHTGFKGSWLSLWLQSLGAEVHGLALEEDTTPNLFNVAQVVANMASHTVGDIRDLGTVQKAMQAAQPDIVIHMAAQALVRRSYVEPVETYATNVMGTVHVLEAARHIPGIKAIVVVTTDKCYETKSGSGVIVRLIRWAGTTLTATAKAARSWLPAPTVIHF